MVNALDCEKKPSGCILVLLAYLYLLIFHSMHPSKNKFLLDHLRASDLQNSVATQCVQLHGGSGYMWEYPIAK